MRRINQHRAISQFRSPSTISAIAVNDRGAQSAIAVDSTGGRVHYRDVGLVTVGHLTNNFITGDSVTMNIGSKSSGGENPIANTFREGIMLGTLGIASWVLQGLAGIGGMAGGGISDSLAGALGKFAYVPSEYTPMEIAIYAKKKNSQLTDGQVLEIVSSLLRWVPQRGIPMRAFMALITQESTWNPGTINRANPDGTVDYGLCQLNSGVGGSGYGHGPELMQIDRNIELGSSEYGAKLQRAHGDVRQAYARYNGGDSGYMGGQAQRNSHSFMSHYNEIPRILGH